MFFSWIPDFNSNTPLYIQLANHLYATISSGQFANGAKLPSQRMMAKKFGVGRNTVIYALEKLTKAGLITAHAKSGIYIARHTPETAPEWEGYFRRANYRPGIDEYRMWRDKEELRDLALSSEFDNSVYFQEAITAAAVRTKDMKLTNAYGLLSLRESIVEYMKTINVQTVVDNIIICPSLDQTIYTLCATLMSSGAHLIHEKSTLVNTISNIHSLGLNRIPVKQDKFGIISEQLEQVLTVRSHAVLLTDPIAHAPTGITTTKKRQKELMKLIMKHRIPVIENGHKRDSWCDKPYPPPMKALPNNENIIYMGTFLKSAVRLGVTWVVADKAFVDQLSNVLVQFSTLPSSISQILADEMFRSGSYYTMMEDTRSFIRRRRDMALELCNRYLKDVATWNEERCGFHFWIRMNQKLNKDKIYDAPNFFPGYFFDKNDTNHILLSPAALPKYMIEETVQSIARLATEKD